jgi:predicted aspartyl protease
MRIEGGIFVVRVQINGVIPLDFTVDSGAADVSIPADVVSTLMRTGTIQDSDFVGSKMYILADGSTVPSATFLIRSLEVGGHLIENVMGRVASAQAPLLLGQSFLSCFNSWSIDNKRQVLLLEAPSTPQSKKEFVYCEVFTERADRSSKCPPDATPTGLAKPAKGPLIR